MNFSRVTEVFPSANPAWLRQIELQAPHYGIDTAHEMASFLAQCGHETRGFTRFEENLNYSASRLIAVWPKRFPDLHIALQYAHNPEALANKVYEGRMGNDQPGDGYKYRGRGAIMLTGKNNYFKAGTITKFNLVTEPHRLLEPAVGVEVALAWWKASGLDDFDDDAEAREESEIINGGSIGLKERQVLLEDLLKVLV